MDIFFLLLGKILPLYVIILLGFFAGQRLKVDREAVSTLVIYLIVPIIFFGATAQMEIRREFLALPFAIFAVAVTLGLGLHKLAGHIWKDGRKNLIGYMMGTANQGYFGIPVFLALFGGDHLGLYVFAGLGLTMYENTFGYYLLARGKYTVRESLMRLLRLPILPAAILGFAYSALGFHLPPAALDLYNVFKGCYTVLGMMLIGLGLSRLHHLKSDMKFTGFAFAGKFILWPLLCFGFLTGYEALMGGLLPITRQIVMLIAMMPIAANAVAFAVHLKIEPDKAATLVVLSTLFALFYIPLMLQLLGMAL